MALDAVNVAIDRYLEGVITAGTIDFHGYLPLVTLPRVRGAVVAEEAGDHRPDLGRAVQQH